MQQGILVNQRVRLLMAKGAWLRWLFGVLLWCAITLFPCAVVRLPILPPTPQR